MIVAIITTAIATTTTPSSLPDAVELLLQRRGLVGHLAEHAGDAAHLGLHAGGDDDRPAAAVGRAVPLKTMLWRSPSAASAAIVAASFETGRLSPVSAASAVCSAVDWITRASAGIVSPSSTRMMSPGTISRRRHALPVRRRGRRGPGPPPSARSAATADSARDSWTYPMTALSRTTAPMAIAS